MDDTFIPSEADVTEISEDVEQSVSEPLFPNLAEDEELVAKVKAFVGHYYDKHKSNREPLEDVWNVADWMFKCAQDDATQSVESGRTDRTSGSDDMKTTKAQKVGSSVFFREVQTLAAMFSQIINDSKTPLRLIPIYDTNTPDSSAAPIEESDTGNLLLRQTMEWDDMRRKLVELAVMLFKYGNIPVCIEWKKEYSEVLDWFTQADGITKTLQRKKVPTKNYPSLGWILPENFYFDPNIGDIQSQPCIMVKGPVGIGDILNQVEVGEYVNFDKINKSHLYRGDTIGTKDNKEANSGLDGTDDLTTGLFLQFDIHCMLPIDETKPKGKRWDDKKHVPKRFWITAICSEKPDDGVFVRIQRNRDPDDLYPVQVISWMPDDSDQLFKVSLAQLIRGNFSEATTSKLQAIDARTLNNNRPIKIRRGNVRMADGSENFKWDKDAVFICEQDINGDVGVEPPMQVQDNMNMLSYLDSDCDEIAGTGRVMRGEPMGGRTSSSEATNAYNAAARPHFMKFRYIFETLFGFYARILRYWQVYGDEQVLIRATGNGRPTTVNPRALRVNYSTHVICVDEYEKNILQQDKFAYAARTMIPLIPPQSMDVVGILIEAFQEVLDWDISKYRLNDNSKAEAAEAKYENGVFAQGAYIPINADDNDDVHLNCHKSERLKYDGLEEQFPWLPLMDRHIAEHEFAKKNKAGRAAMMQQAAGGMATPENPSGNQTVGEAAGNQIAAQLGAMAGGQ